MFRLNTHFSIILFLTFLCSGIYLWFVLFPDKITPDALQHFTLEQISRGQQYSKAMRLSFISGFLAQFTFLLWFVASGRAYSLSLWTQQAAGGNYWLQLLLFFSLLWLLLQVLHLPFAFFSTYIWQHHWGLSTQTASAWLWDRSISLVLDLILSGSGLLILFMVMKRWPDTWWLIGAALMSLWLIIQSFLWPVIISPVFNKFQPADNPALIRMIDELASKAGIPVEQVLIMDASKRTVKANAYFAGLGNTKRIVLYDTLLANYPFDEVKAVIAHEMAHWRQRHIIKGLVLGIAGNFLFWLILFRLLRLSVFEPPASQPHTWAIILLIIMSVSLLSSPLISYFSRSMETEADIVAVHLTRDIKAATRLQKNLAVNNLSDVSPPVFIRWFSYSHPPAVERINTVLQAKFENN